MAYFREGEEQSGLSLELDATQLLLSKQSAKLSTEEFSNQQQELESRLTRAESQISTAKTKLRQSIESSEVTDTLFEVAETSAVEIIEISSAGVTSESLEEISLSVFALTVKVEGEVPNLIDFFFELSQQFPTGVSESIEINAEEQLATFILRIHTYEGD